MSIEEPTMHAEKKKYNRRKNITLPELFVEKLEILKERRGGVSESEVLRQAITLLEAMTTPGKKITMEDEKTGEKTLLMFP